MIVWDAVNGRPVLNLPDRENREAFFSAACFSQDSDFIAIGYESGRINVFDLGTGQLRSSIDCGEVGTRLRFFMGNTSLLVTDDDHGSCLWSVNSGALVRRIKGMRLIASSDQAEFMIGCPEDGDPLVLDSKWLKHIVH
jgi:WD40 repeat protein